jgi:hypothetical protein
MPPTKFKARAVSSRGVGRFGGWAIKVYGITAGRGSPRRRLVEAAERLAPEVLPDAPAGHGFVVVHEAVPACFLAVHWWATPVDLFQRYFRAEHGSPERLVEIESATIGCVWELAVVAHERDAWVQHSSATRIGPTTTDTWTLGSAAPPRAVRAGPGRRDETRAPAAGDTSGGAQDS